MNKSSISGLMWGMLLILAVGAWLVSNIFQRNIDFGIILPVFLLVPGLMLWGSYLLGGEDKIDALIPANILLFLSITFFFNTFTSSVLGYERAWILTVAMYSTGPVAIAFWITWVASGRKPGYLIPAVILTIISGCIALFTVPIALFDSRLFADLSNLGIPVMLILIGLLIIFGPIWSRMFEPKTQNAQTQEEPSSEVMEEVEEAEVVEDEEIKDTEEKQPETEAEVDKDSLNKAEMI